MFAQNEILWSDVEWVQFLIIVVISLLLAIILRIVINSVLSRLSQVEKLHFDNRNTKSMGNLIFWILIFIGFYFALERITIFKEYLKYRDFVFFLVIAFFIGKFIVQFIKFALERLLKSNDVYKSSSKTIINIVNFVIYSIVLLIVLAYFEIDISPLVAALGISGIAIGLAVQAPLANFFAGLFILSSNPLRNGEYIEMDGNISGYVEEIGWFSTKIKTLSNTMIIIPNSKITNTIVMNQTRIITPKWVGVTFGVNPTEDLDRVEKMALAVAIKVRDSHSECMKDIMPIVRYQTIGDYSINLRVMLNVEKIDYQAKITHELIKCLSREMIEQKIDRPLPIHRVELLKE